MQLPDIESLASMRAVVGYLGEKEQHGWWPCSFFVTGSSAFLSPIFPRTQFLAQCQGVTAAALRKHDERIGVGQVYHLFRLPEDIEQGLHRILHDENIVGKIRALVDERDAALNFLRQSETGGTDGVGPTRVGNTADLRTAAVWRLVATKYARRFESGSEVYPYFTDGK